jgi:hypothetical protein
VDAWRGWSRRRGARQCASRICSTTIALVLAERRLGASRRGVVRLIARSRPSAGARRAESPALAEPAARRELEQFGRGRPAPRYPCTALSSGTHAEGSVITQRAGPRRGDVCDSASRFSSRSSSSVVGDVVVLEELLP